MKYNTILKTGLIVWMGLVIVASFLWAKAAQGFPGETSRIMIYHVPQAWIAGLSFLISMIFSVRYLARRHTIDDLVASTAAELGLIFCILATVTGSIFAKTTWGSYWNWDPRETSIVILLMIYGAYFALRSAIPDPERKSTLTAAYAVLAFVTVPFFMFILPRITVSLHPESTMNPTDPQLDGRFLIVFINSLGAFTALFIWIFNLKYRLTRLQQKLDKGQESWATD